MTERVKSKVLLVMFWVCGLTFGQTAAALLKATFPHILCPIPIMRISVSSIALKLFASLVITFIALILEKPWIFYPAALLKAFCVSYSVTAFTCVSDQGICTAAFYGFSGVLLILFWLRYIPGFSPKAFRDLLICAMLFIAVSLVMTFICFS